MSSMLSWLAPRRVEITAVVRAEESRYYLEHYRAGWHEREAEGLSYLWGGWVLMTTFLRDRWCTIRVRAGGDPRAGARAPGAGP